MSNLSAPAQIALVGIGATALMDAWLLLLARLGVPASGFTMLGRWVGHAARGRFAHDAIVRAAPVRFELALGWLTHYVVGIAWAALLVALQGVAWLERPTVQPALLAGAATVAAPWFVMQPAMGAGVMARKTAAPLDNAARSLANHLVFGAGLYATAAALAVWPA